MFRLNLPPYPTKIQEKGEKRQIFDFLRRKWVALTPEEWVRQHFTHYLVEQKGYPKGLLAPYYTTSAEDLRPDIGLQPSAESGLSYRQQRTTALLLQDGLRPPVLPVP